MSLAAEPATLSEAPDAAPDDEARRVWYFGIGSMMSPIALGMRDIRPVRSLWCEIPGYRKVFYASSGMATLVPEEGAVAQAVAHEMTQAELTTLEGREPPSVAVCARLRGAAGGGAVVEGVVSVATNFVFMRGVHASAEQVGARVFQAGSDAFGRITAVAENGIHVQGMGPMEFGTSGPVMVEGQPPRVPLNVVRTPPILTNPSVRYLDLMLEGAKAVGMDEDVVAEIATTPCTPRKDAHEYRRLPVDGSVTERRFSQREVDESEGLFVIRGMVFEQPLVNGVRPTVFGRGSADLAKFLAQQLRDPLYGSPPEDPMEPWAGWAFIEDMICTGFLPGLKHVGWVERGQRSKL